MSIKIRKAIREDVSEIIRMMADFADFEGFSQYFENTEEALASAIFDEGNFVEALVALADDRHAGYALFFPFYSSFRGQSGYYLDDLYIAEQFRSSGLGERLLRKIAELAAERGFCRIDFQVLAWNTSAAKFYKRLGAEIDDEEQHFRFVDDAFLRLAGNQ